MIGVCVVAGGGEDVAVGEGNRLRSTDTWTRDTMILKKIRIRIWRGDDKKNIFHIFFCNLYEYFTR